MTVAGDSTTTSEDAMRSLAVRELPTSDLMSTAALAPYSEATASWGNPPRLVYPLMHYLYIGTNPHKPSVQSLAKHLDTW